MTRRGTAAGALTLILLAAAGRAEETASDLGEPPPSLSQADLEARARRFDQAVKGYEAALRELAQGKGQPSHRPFIYLKLARAHRAAGRTDQALAALRTLRRECGDCRLRPESYRESVDAARERKDRPALLKVLEEMRAEPEPLRGMAELEAARLRIEDSDPVGAEEVLARLAEDPRRPYAAEARLWRLRALRAAKKERELEGACRAVLDPRDGDPREGAAPSREHAALVQAAASALGELLLERAAGDAAGAREALLASARAIALGPPAAEEPPDDYARALLAAGGACMSLAAGAARPESKQHYLNRAQGYYREVARHYRDTEWARAAAAELAKVEEKARG